MADILTAVAAIEWVTLGIIVFWQQRKLNERLSKALDELEKEYDNG